MVGLLPFVQREGGSLRRTAKRYGPSLCRAQTERTTARSSGSTMCKMCTICLGVWRALQRTSLRWLCVLGRISANTNITKPRNAKRFSKFARGLLASLALLPLLWWRLNHVSMFPTTLARAFSSVPRAVTSLPSATRPSLPRYVSPSHRPPVVCCRSAAPAGWLALNRTFAC